MAQWDDVQAKAKKLFDEGLVLLKSGAKDAEFIAGTTATAARLQVQVSKNKYELYRLLHDLGQLTLDATTSSDTGSIKVTSEMKPIIKRIKEIEKGSKSAEKELSKFTIVDKKKPKTKKVKVKTTGKKTSK